VNRYSVRLLVLPAMLAALGGCAQQPVAHYSPYDLDRDGVMDLRCPGMRYEPETGYLMSWSWRSEGSRACEERAPAA
jgi:hypothetical protein